MPNENLERRIKYLELQLRSYRRRFRAFLKAPRYAVSRSEAQRLVEYWKKTLDDRHIWYVEEEFIEKNLADAYEMLEKMPLGMWIDFIQWFWKMKPSNTFWSRVGVWRLQTARKAQPDWAALQETQHAAGDTKPDLSDYGR